jgi:hypothetical protein
MLRREASRQIEALSLQGTDDKPYDQELVDAIMTDDASYISHAPQRFVVRPERILRP